MVDETDNTELDNSEAPLPVVAETEVTEEVVPSAPPPPPEEPPGARVPDL